MRNQQFPDNFASQNDISVASHNRVNVKGDLVTGNSTAVTIVVCFVLVCLSAMIVFLAVRYGQLLTIIVVGLPVLACATLVFVLLLKLYHLVVRESAKTRAMKSYYQAQETRNAVVEAKPGSIVIYDPQHAYRIETARESVYHITETGQQSLAEQAESKHEVDRPSRWQPKG